MKKIEELNKRKVPIVTIDPALDKYRDKIMFPKKLEKANKMLKTAKFPSNKHIRLQEPDISCSDKAKSTAEE